MNQGKICKHPVCGKPIPSGKASKVYCNGICRSAHYRLVNQQGISAEVSLTRGNRNNRKVLLQILERLPLSDNYKDCVDISKETLLGAGYDLNFSGMATMIKFKDKMPQVFKYDSVWLIAHPDQQARFLVTRELWK